MLPKDAVGDGEVRTHIITGPSGELLFSVERTVEMAQSQGGAAMRAVDFEVAVPSSLSIDMDEHDLTEILGSLGENAMKWARGGGFFRLRGARRRQGVGRRRRSRDSLIRYRDRSKPRRSFAARAFRQRPRARNRRRPRGGLWRISSKPLTVCCSSLFLVDARAHGEGPSGRTPSARMGPATPSYSVFSRTITSIAAMRMPSGAGMSMFGSHSSGMSDSSSESSR